jgi:hypothetical protein
MGELFASSVMSQHNIMSASEDDAKGSQIPIFFTISILIL